MNLSSFYTPLSITICECNILGGREGCPVLYDCRAVPPQEEEEEEDEEERGSTVGQC